MLEDTVILMFVVDIQIPLVQQQPVSFQLVSEAQAILGVRRRSFRRGVVVGASVGAAATTSASASTQQQEAPAQQQAAPAPQQSVTSPEPGAKPIGTVVSTLPSGCTSVQIGGVDYQKCGPDYYRAAFQGNNLVYVTTQP